MADLQLAIYYVFIEQGAFDMCHHSVLILGEVNAIQIT